MQKHPACIFLENGWVETDNHKAINCVTSIYMDELLSSPFYKNKEGIYWPVITKNTTYKSSFKTNVKIVSYYDTEYLHHITRYNEFTPKQFKESLLFLCEVCIYCFNHGIYIQSHLWNITYVEGKPIIIDIRDFKPLLSHNWIEIFSGHFREHIDNHNIILASHFMDNFLDIRKRLLSVKNNPYSILEIIKDIKEKDIIDGQWMTYHANRVDFLNEAIKIDKQLYEKIKTYGGGSYDDTKSISLMSVIERYKPHTLIEIGCNNGLYCYAASTHSHVVGIDYDLGCIDKCNQLNKQFQTNSVFIHCDILNHTENSKSHGLNGSYGDIYSRIRSDMLVAPAVVHHLYSACKSMDEIIRQFTRVANEIMLIESIAISCEEELREAIDKYGWTIIEVLPSSPKPRKYLLCTIRR